MRHAIFMTFDDTYSKFAKNCLKSIKQNYPNHPEVLVFYDGEKSSTFKFLNNLSNVKLVPYQDKFLDLDGISLGRVNSKKIYFRYILWSSQFDEYDTILHLDVDTIIRQPLDDLFSQTEFFSVLDFTPSGYTLFKKQHYDDKKLIELLKDDNLLTAPSEFSMMNAGVFVLQKKYRTAQQLELLWNITKRYNTYTEFADQAAISLWCYCNKIHFSPDIRYNFQLAFSINPLVFFNLIVNYKIQASEVKILHYTWWKPKSQYHKSILEVSALMTESKNYLK